MRRLRMEVANKDPGGGHTLCSQRDGLDSSGADGSGKTAAFSLPILQALLEHHRPFFACVLSPTRELAIQIAEQFEGLGAAIGLVCSVVLDEADVLLNMEFEKSLDDILKIIPKERRTFLFSATMTDKVKKLQRACLRNPVKVVLYLFLSFSFHFISKFWPFDVPFYSLLLMVTTFF